MSGTVGFFVLIAWALVAWVGLCIAVDPLIKRALRRAERRAIERIKGPSA